MELEDRVWLACAIDTDGYVGIKDHRFKRRERRYRYFLPAIGFGNSHRGLTEHFGKIIGVATPPPPHDAGGKPHYKKMNRVQLHNTKKIKKILEDIIPYLIAKKERAEYVLAYCNHRLDAPGDHGPSKSARHQEDEKWYNEYASRFKRITLKA